MIIMIIDHELPRCKKSQRNNNNNNNNNNKLLWDHRIKLIECEKNDK